MTGTVPCSVCGQPVHGVPARAALRHVLACSRKCADRASRERARHLEAVRDGMTAAEPRGAGSTVSPSTPPAQGRTADAIRVGAPASTSVLASAAGGSSSAPAVGGPPLLDAHADALSEQDGTAGVNTDSPVLGPRGLSGPSTVAPAAAVDGPPTGNACGV